MRSKLIYLDINGPEEPNWVGKDLFVFHFNSKFFLKPYPDNIQCSDFPEGGSGIGNCRNNITTQPYYQEGGCAARIIRCDDWKIKYW